MTVKRLLSIDGGGIRGIIAAEVLVAIEKALKENKQCERLSDYFDFISGTSTGSIIAAGLAIGMSAQEILNIYTTKGKQIFSSNNNQYSKQDIIEALGIKKEWGKQLFVKGLLKLFKGQQEALKQKLFTRYTGEYLEKELSDVFGDITMTSPNGLKTNLMIVTNNVTQGEVWFFTNNSVKGTGTYNEKSKYLNLYENIPLWKIVRSSCAAPTFFPPFSITVKVPNQSSTTKYEEKECEFIDGAISPYNNPSFQLFLEAVHPDYNTGWETGVDKILLVSVGTGYAYTKIESGKAKESNNAVWGQYVIEDLMSQVNRQQNHFMKLVSQQKMSNNSSNFLNKINKFKIVPEKKELFTYCRFTTSFTVDRFKQLMKDNFLQLKDENKKLILAEDITNINKVVNNLKKMDCVDQIDNLSAIGQAVAQEQFDISLFPDLSKDENVSNESSKNE
ncbi:Patatin [Gloeothece citriformis PCC 7424]|uniref:Patatin n=1 Tax=Gloeothece citriformis (strain PCC 7424) TaxID=65393 RepID=B7KKW9_GLOC7|nr:patatin-like phospholipase family protein [Gloeothece citriformis]ACK71088.1 Patatin [Gloeothece citriformis PCC 7424]